MDHQSGLRHVCAQDCRECHRICQETLSHYLHGAGVTADPAYLQLLLDCFSICKTTADVLSRETTYGAELAVVCARVCALCAEYWKELPGDPHLTRFANICRRTAGSCHALAHPRRTNRRQSVLIARSRQRGFKSKYSRGTVERDFPGEGGMQPA